MKTISFLLSLLLISFQGFCQAKYYFSVDLTAIKNDKVTVNLITPKIKQAEAIYHLPKIVPGTYTVSNYSAFISNLKAFDKNGKALRIEKIDTNSWKILGAKKLFRISYEVDDTWDSPEIKQDVFQPSGTNIEEGKLFVLNNFGFFGYFEGYKELPFQLNVTKPKEFYGSTSLTKSDSNEDKDVFEAFNYNELADSPVMYNQPDTCSFKIANTKVLVSLVSSSNKIKSKDLAKEIIPVLEAQKKYLGGTLPADKYAFLIYLSDNTKETKFGALEHMQSSLYYLPSSMSPDELYENMKHAAAHEFLHIVTPLNIHSKEIGNFDYINPKMSKHLWLYEGLTEYAALHSQLQAGLINISEFLKAFRTKIIKAEDLYDNNLPFTQLSLQVLDKQKDQYDNVYEKGALIGLCLDLKLRKLSNGRYGTQNLVLDLMNKYGKFNSFDDERLFDVITALTYPEIRTFFKNYVEAAEALPLKELLNEIGVLYTPVKNFNQIKLWTKVNVMFDTDRVTFVNSEGKEYPMTDLAKKIGLIGTDEIVSINGEKIGFENLDSFTKQFEKNSKPGDKIAIVILRKQPDGSRKEITLRSELFESPFTYEHIFDVYYEDSLKVKLRNDWLQQQ